MSDDYNNEEFAGSKWLILKELSEKPASPKQLSEKLDTTIANMSQQLKLLEAYGYVKKNRIDKGKGGRKGRISRIVYSIEKNQVILTSIQPNFVMKKELRTTAENQYIVNLLLIDPKECTPFLLKFPLNHEKLFNLIDALFFLRLEKEDIHLLVITENLTEFRNEKSKLEIEYAGKKKNLRFWSHSLPELKEGLQRKEKYFTDQMSVATLLYEKKPNTISKIKEETR